MPFIITRKFRFQSLNPNMLALLKSIFLKIISNKGTIIQLNLKLDCDIEKNILFSSTPHP